MRECEQLLSSLHFTCSIAPLKPLNDNCTYCFFVPCPIPRCKCPSQNTLPKCDDEIHQPKPSKQMINLHSEKIPYKQRETSKGQVKKSTKGDKENWIARKMKNDVDIFCRTQLRNLEANSVLGLKYSSIGLCSCQSINNMSFSKNFSLAFGGGLAALRRYAYEAMAWLFLKI